MNNEPVHNSTVEEVFTLLDSPSSNSSGVLKVVVTSADEFDDVDSMFWCVDSPASINANAGAGSDTSSTTTTTTITTPSTGDAQNSTSMNETSTPEGTDNSMSVVNAAALAMKKKSLDATAASTALQAVVQQSCGLVTEVKHRVHDILSKFQVSRRKASSLAMTLAKTNLDLDDTSAALATSVLYCESTRTICIYIYMDTHTHAHTCI